MTIKFWKNWQKRLKETKCIVLYQLMFAEDWENSEYISNYTLNAENIISYSFNKDNVKLSISDYNTNGDRVLATMKLKRIDIKTIIFNKYKKIGNI